MWEDKKIFAPKFMEKMRKLLLNKKYLGDYFNGKSYPFVGCKSSKYKNQQNQLVEISEPLVLKPRKHEFPVPKFEITTS